jgi:hypothetical protein
MRRQTKRLAIAVVLTIVDVAACNYYCGVIWQVFARYLFTKAALLGLLCLWVATGVVIWLHVAYDVRQIFRARSNRLAFDPVTASFELRRDRNV